jgi:hypothetical protein
MSSEEVVGLTEDDCRYIVGDLGGDWHYCRAPRARHADGSYKRWMWCDAHRRVVIVSAKPYVGRRPLPAHIEEAA